MRQLKLVVAILLAIVCIIVIVQNTETVDTRLLFVTVTMPRAALLLVTFLMGGVVGMILSNRLTKSKATKNP